MGAEVHFLRGLKDTDDHIPVSIATVNALTRMEEHAVYPLPWQNAVDMDDLRFAEAVPKVGRLFCDTSANDLQRTGLEK